MAEQGNGIRDKRAELALLLKRHEVVCEREGMLAEIARQLSNERVAARVAIAEVIGSLEHTLVCDILDKVSEPANERGALNSRAVGELMDTMMRKC